MRIAACAMRSAWNVERAACIIRTNKGPEGPSSLDPQSANAHFRMLLITV